MRYFFTFLSSIIIFSTQGQDGIIEREAILYFDKSVDTARLTMNGLLDASNTLTYPNNYAFQHMKKLRISNKGTETIINPQLILNNRRNWYNINTISSECFAGATTGKDKALAVWKFVRDNRVHGYEPDLGKEIDDPVKLLTVYGYGMCYNVSFTAASIAATLPHVGIPYMEFSPRNRHSVKDIKIDDSYVLLDPDIEVFYLKTDNKSLANYHEISNDKYLINRVHHYGKARTYNFFNKFIANAIYEPASSGRFAGLYSSLHTLDFELRPGESIEYNWEQGKHFHHNFLGTSPDDAPKNDIRNGQLIYSTNFTHHNFDEFLSAISNLEIFSNDGIKPNLHSIISSDTSSFTAKFSSPFVIVNGTIRAKLYRNDNDDYIDISFSKDSLSWDQIWVSNQVGNQLATIPMYESIEPIGNKACYSYYLKFKFVTNDLLNPSGIDSLNVITNFQVSKYFLPSLQLGENIISYSDKNISTRSVEIKINWEESWDNFPPAQVTLPLFPKDESIVDSLKFTFHWEPSQDSEGIEDYEFILSDRPDFKFPLSPSFRIYTSEINKMEPTLFPIQYEGLLNSDTEYYWKVRAKDSKGAWGKWSPTWSFTPRGPMPPEIESSELRNETIFIVWNKNHSGVQPMYYEVHASNEAYGFTPSQQTLIGTTQTEYAAINYKKTPKTFYRIVAVDKNGSKSGASNYISILYPYSFEEPDSIKGNHPFQFALKTNHVFTTDGILLNDEYYNVKIYDTIGIKTLHKPDWISFDQKQSEFYGSPNFLESQKGDSIIVEYTGVLVNGQTFKNFQTFKLKHGINRSPHLLMKDSVAYANSMFNSTIEVKDPDIEFGDFISQVKIINQPTWLNITFNSDNSIVNTWGVPTFKDLGDTLLTVEVFDALGISTIKTFPIKVLGLRDGSNFSVAPNPFGNETYILYRVDSPGKVIIQIYDSHSAKVQDLDLQIHKSGVYSYLWNPGSLSPGVYLLVIKLIESPTGKSQFLKGRMIKSR